MKYRLHLASLSIFVLLTIVSQVGGLLVLIHHLFFQGIKKRFGGIFKRKLIYYLSLSLFYFLGIVFFIPALSKPFGREPLPWNSDLIEAFNIIKEKDCDTIIKKFQDKFPDWSKKAIIRLIFILKNYECPRK